MQIYKVIILLSVTVFLKYNFTSLIAPLSLNNTEDKIALILEKFLKVNNKLEAKTKLY